MKVINREVVVEYHLIYMKIMKVSCGKLSCLVHPCPLFGVSKLFLRLAAHSETQGKEAGNSR